MTPYGYGGWIIDGDGDVSELFSRYEEWCKEWQTTRPPKGESFLDLAERVAAFCDDLKKREEGNILIVAHHAVLQQIMANLLEADAASCWHYAFEQGTYSLFEINHGFAVLKGHNIPASE